MPKSPSRCPRGHPGRKPGFSITRQVFVVFSGNGTESLKRRARVRYAFICTFVVAVSSAALRAGEPCKEVEEHLAMPKAGGEPTLRLDVLMSRTIWGEWERARFDYRIVNATKQPIQFEDGDPGRGFAGKIMVLRDPRDKIKAFGAHWAAPPHYRPNFWGRPKTFDAGAVVHENPAWNLPSTSAVLARADTPCKSSFPPAG